MNLKIILASTLILLTSTTAISKTPTKLKAKNGKSTQVKILSFYAVKKLSSKSKKDYVRAITQTLINLNKEPKDKYSKNILNFILGDIHTAYATTNYLCIGGGIPIPSDSSVCGVNSYAGFTCPEGLEICNPLIFGVDKDQKPVCHETATTRWCFQNTKLGVDHFLEPVFELNNQSKWNELLTYLEQACNNPASVSEAPEKVLAACEFVRRQMVYNEEVKKILTEGYSYQTVDGYGIQPPAEAVTNPDAEAIGAGALRAIEETRTEDAAE